MYSIIYSNRIKYHGKCSFFRKLLYTMPVVSVTLYFGLKEINTVQKHTFSSPGNQLVFIGN